MNEPGAISVLKLRLELTGETYRPATVASWTQALSDLEADVVGPALYAIADAGDRITVPAIRDWLREQTAATRRSEAMRTPTHPCGCSAGALCDSHRDRNLAAISAIRAERGWRQPGGS